MEETELNDSKDSPDVVIVVEGFNSWSKRSVIKEEICCCFHLFGFCSFESQTIEYW